MKELAVTKSDKIRARKSAVPNRKKNLVAGAVDQADGRADQWNLRLYVAGQTPKSVAALANLLAFCKEHLNDSYNVEVIDLLKEPWHARTDQIVAIPTLVRRLPAPARKIIGDLSDKERVLVGFDLLPQQKPVAKPDNDKQVLVREAT